MDSIWVKTAEKPRFDSLNEDSKTDVLIVGGGLAGILCAYRLQQAGVDYLLIEAAEICGGITKNTTAKVTAQHGLIYNSIIEMYGVDAARKYYTVNSRAIEQYRRLCKKYNCRFDTKDAYVYAREDRTEIEKEIRAYEQIGATVTFTEDTPLPFKIAGAVKLQGQGQIHPLEFLYTIAKDLHIKEYTKLRHFLPHAAKTDKGTIHFKKAIIATHFPILNKHGYYFLKLYQHRSYVLALENAAKVDGMYVDADMKGLSFREHDDLLLLGGGSHRTGKQGGSYTELSMFTERHYPQATVKARFATQDCMSIDGLPYIGQYAKGTPDLFVATGFNKWGFTTAMAAAELLCDAVRGIPHEEGDIFSPQRRILHPQLAVNGVETAVNLLTPTAPRCPHLGCALKYNTEEHTWDCPCHGSRFTAAGDLIDNPATDDASFKKRIQ